MAVNMPNADYYTFFLWNELGPRYTDSGQRGPCLELMWVLNDRDEKIIKCEMERRHKDVRFAYKVTTFYNIHSAQEVTKTW